MPKTKEPQPAVEHADDIEYRQRIESDVAGLKQQISELRRELGLSVMPPQPPVVKPPEPHPLQEFTEKHGGRAQWSTLGTVAAFSRTELRYAWLAVACISY